MLTDFELKWLEGRKTLCSRCDCYLRHLMNRSSCWDGMRKGWDVRECKMFWRAGCSPSSAEYEDAAKFEALVAMILTWPILYRFLQVKVPGQDTGEALCDICKKQGLAKLSGEGLCVRTTFECRRMHAMLEAERHLAAGTLPTCPCLPLGLEEEEEE